MRIKDKKEKVAAYMRKIDPRHKEKTVDQMEETIEDLMEEIKALENEIKNSQLLKESDSQKTAIDISPACTLKKVTDHETRENRNGKIVNVTRLYFEEDVPIRTMDQWADKNGTITELAKQMIGKKVRTTVWKPETYNVSRWWNNIYEVRDTLDEAEFARKSKKLTNFLAEAESELLQSKKVREKARKELEKETKELKIINKELEKESEKAIKELEKARELYNKEFDNTFTLKNMTTYQTLEKVEAIIRRNDRPEIHLYFKGNTMPRKNNWYKDFNDRLELCKSLVGKKIATDVYGKWDKNAWFKNIYVLNEDDDIPF